MPPFRGSVLEALGAPDWPAAPVPHRVRARWPGAARMLLYLMLAAAFCLPASIANGITLEERIKAASLYKFLGYVEWPRAAFGSATSSYVVGVAGAPDIAQELARISADRTINGRAVAVRTVKPGEPLAGVQLLFIGRAENARLERWLEAAQNQPILTVTEADGALERGSMINFRIVEDRVRFEVALDTAEKAGLRISARMLSVALSVSKEERR